MKRRTTKIRPETIIIGKLWAKWCPHCISLIPHWNEMKKIIQQKSGFPPKYMEIEESEIHKIDEYNQSRSDGEFIDKAKGYPTIYKIQGGKIHYYDGERTGKAMADWMMSGVVKGGKRKKLKSRKNRVKA
jgi:hypothetical protein